MWKKTRNLGLKYELEELHNSLESLPPSYFRSVLH